MQIKPYLHGFFYSPNVSLLLLDYESHTYATYGELFGYT